MAARYGLALGFFFAALTVKLEIPPGNDSIPFLTFYPATAITAVLLGAGPGLLTVLLGGVAYWGFLPSTGQLGQYEMVITFAVAGAAVCLVVLRSRRGMLTLADTLEASEARFRLAQDMSLDAFVILKAVRDPAGRVVDFTWEYVNPTARRGMGMTETDMSRTLREVMPHAALPGGLIERHGRVVETGEPAEYEVQCGSPENPRWFRNVVVKVDDGVAVTYSDVTTEKLANWNLRASEQRLATAMELRRIAIGNYDTDLKYTFISNSTLGRRMADVVGKDDTTTWEPESAERVMAFLREVLASGTPARREMVLRPKGAERSHHYDFVVAPLLDADGAVSGLTCAAANIDAEMEIRQKLEAADAAKSRFLAAASHDLRQPFQAMRLFQSVLETQPLAPTAEDAVANLGKALAAGEELLTALLDVSAFEAGTVSPKPALVPLARVIDEVAAEIREQAQEQGLTLRVVTLPDLVETDRVLLKRMIRNLVHNALRYTVQGGVLIACRRRGGHILVQVWDTGRGIPEDKFQAIFQDFYQLRNPARDRSKGLGLGLSIVQRTAQLLGHRVTVASRPGRGSVFTIVLPAAGNAAPRQRPELKNAPTTRSPV